MNITVREYKSEDAHIAAEIWNEVVRDGVAFPQENEMSDSDKQLLMNLSVSLAKQK